MIPIIIDTDLDTDCDDIGALAVAHNLAARDKCRIAAVVCNAPVEAAPPCARAVNRYFGQSAIPVGKLAFEPDAPAYSRYFEHRARCRAANLLYNETIAEHYSLSAADAPPFEEGVTLYRRILSGQPDHSVAICAIGLLNILAGLLKSRPCRHSPLSGAELIRRKVAKLVIMGKGIFPSGYDTFNWRMAPAAAAEVLNRWPGEIVISPVGDDIQTGRHLLRQERRDPIADAYKIFLKGSALRPSWDQLAVMYTVLGAGDIFEVRDGYRMTFSAEDGRHEWIRDATPPHPYRRLELKAAPDRVAAAVEALMTPPVPFFQNVCETRLAHNDEPFSYSIKVKA